MKRTKLFILILVALGISVCANLYSAGVIKEPIDNIVLNVQTEACSFYENRIARQAIPVYRENVVLVTKHRGNTVHMAVGI